MSNLTAAFSADYATARRRFREAVARLDWIQEAYPIGVAGPDGEELTIDVARFEGDSSLGGLVLSSGLHGVEGFFGSAVQLALLERWSSYPEARPRMRCLLLHGLNPYGFAWLRRFDESNVDPNRNFLLDGEPYAGAPDGYAGLDGLLNPQRPPSAWEPFLLKALWAVARKGMPALQQAIASGQYEFPQGLFYGGQGPTQATRLLSEKLAGWLDSCRQVTHFDFHTGLGKWATGKLLLDYTPTESQRARLINCFGEQAFEACDSSGIAYQARGGFGQWCVARSPDRDYLFVCAEFGTYSPIRVLAGLRAENQSHHWGQPDDPATRRSKRRLKELFCPDSPAWRNAVLRQSTDWVCRVVR